MGISVFISTVSDEFCSYRDQLKDDLERHNVHVKTQENFKDLGDATLDKLDVYIAQCDAVVHLVGDMPGSAPGHQGWLVMVVDHQLGPDAFSHECWIVDAGDPGAGPLAKIAMPHRLRPQVHGWWAGA